MPTTKCRILCVEDHEDTCFMLTSLLGAQDYAAQAAHSLGAATQLVQSQRFDLYILDSRYPDGSGLELCQQIRVLHAQATIIFYSGAASETDKAQGLAAGARAYVVKPDIDGLVATVKAVLKDEACAVVSTA